MLSREELEKLSFDELKSLANYYRVVPVGEVGKPESWIKALDCFPKLGISQTRDGVGLRSPGSNCYLLIGTASDMLGEATYHQMALIRATQMGEWMADENDRYYQEKLMQLYEIKQCIQKLLDLLNRFTING